MKVAITYFLLFLFFSIVFVVPSIILPFPLALKSQDDFGALKLLALLLIDFVSVVYLIKRLNLSGTKLFLAVVLVFWGLQTFMTQIETWYFREAMPAITGGVLLKLFFNPFITAVTFIPVGIWTLGKWKQSNVDQGHRLNLTPIWKEVLALSIIYLIIYFLFGHYVAWQFDEVRIFYSGSPEMHGFAEQFQHTLHIHNLILPFQILRGFLWVLCGLPVIFYLKGGKTGKILTCVFMYSVLPSIQLIVDNPFMPADVRNAHLLEVATSNGLFGLLTGLILCRRMAYISGEAPACKVEESSD